LNHLTHVRLATWTLSVLLLASCSSGSPSKNPGTGGGAGSGTAGTGTGGAETGRGGTTGTGGGAVGGSSSGTGGGGGAVGGSVGGSATGTGGSAGTGVGGTGGSGPTCPTGRTLCNGECVDTTANPLNCNGCGHACGTNQVCASSTCQTPPDCRSTACVGFSYCDLASGLCNPGCAFDTQCSTNETCDVTTHACVCKASTHRCSGVCLDNSSVASCGASCTPCATDPNGVATCNGTACGLTCNSGSKLCSGVCAACPTANVTASACSGNQCVATTCATGFHVCSGACSSNTSVNSCGTTSCTPCATSANGTTTCDGTACGITCATNYKLCGAACAACPTTNVSASACSGTSCVATSCTGSSYRVCNGACAACPTANIGTTTCSGASCVASTCVNGYHVCSGACASNSSVNSCGTTSCTACPTSPNGTASCTAAMYCSLTCTTGYRTCGTTCALCPTNASTTTCSGSTCIAATCPTGNHVCSGQCVTNNSVQTCGASCTACPAGPANSTVSCDGTKCVNTCNAPYVACTSGCCTSCQSSPDVCTAPDWCQPNQVCQSVQKLQPDAGNAPYAVIFGTAVSLSGSVALIGSPGDNNYNGAAYVFERQSSGLWTQASKLIGDPPAAGDFSPNFGQVVAVDGQRVVVGAASEGNLNGAVYLYDGMGGVWGPGPQMKWIGEAAGAADEFGTSVAVSADRVIVGAAGVFPAGVAYIFDRQSDGSWPATGIKILSPDPTNVYGLGGAVAVNGDRVLIGASEAALVYAHQSDGSWALEATLKVATAKSRFGSTVSLSGTRALIGAAGDLSGGTTTGAAYVFDRQANGTWTQTAQLAEPPPNNGPSDEFGWSVSVDGDRALIGARFENRSPGTGGTTGVGSAFLFQRLASGSWNAGTEIHSAPGDEIASRAFGTSVSLSWPYALVGAPGDVPAPPATGGGGTAYMISVQNVAP
jgi:hypothetical protein